MADAVDYDPRYLAGVLFFNRQDYFEAHEVWEDLWAASSLPDRRFYQGLIQAAVGLLHFGNGNVRGAVRLYHSSHEYLKPQFPRHLGLDLEAFWARMTACFAPLLTGEPPGDASPAPELVPTIELSPAPEAWPEPESLLPPE